MRTSTPTNRMEDEVAVTLGEVGGRLRHLGHYLSMLEPRHDIDSSAGSEEGYAEKQTFRTWERWESSREARFAVVVVRCVSFPLADVFPLLSFP
jgi:hypothetical protein